MILSSAATHIGRRQNNEDFFGLSPELGLFLVADGVGGQEGGEIASRLTVSTITEFFARTANDEEITWPYAFSKTLGRAENRVEAAVRLANQEVLRQKVGPLAQMGSTVVLCSVEQDRIIIGHMGDSRAYRLRGGVLEALTIDHSLYEYLKAQSGREMPPREDFAYNNVITKAIGMSGNVRPEVCSEDFLTGDTYLLCSDGLTGPLSDDKIIEILQGEDLEKVSKNLVQAAYDAGGKDNITVVVVRK
jgi:serine/threonine protein phosphatase PrpC